MSGQASPSLRAVARYLRDRFQGEANVSRYVSDEGERSIDILEVAGPWENVTSWATLGLSDYEMIFGETAVRVELLGATLSNAGQFGNILASAAFEVLLNGPACRPGAMYFNVLPQYDLSSTMTTLLLVSPFPWDGLAPLDLDDRRVHWLMAIPVSDAEALMVDREGLEALENLFERRQTDVFDLQRPSEV